MALCLETTKAGHDFLESISEEAMEEPHRKGLVGLLLDIEDGLYGCQEGQGLPEWFESYKDGLAELDYSCGVEYKDFVAAFAAGYLTVKYSSTGEPHHH